MSNTLTNIDNFFNTLGSVPTAALKGYMDLVSAGKDTLIHAFGLPGKTVDAAIDISQQIVLTPTQLATSVVQITDNVANVSHDIASVADSGRQAIESPNIAIIAVVIGVISVMSFMKPY